MARYGKRKKPKCKKEHELKLIDKKNPRMKVGIWCDACGAAHIEKTNLIYHCKDCGYDKCYDCEKYYPPILALKTSPLNDYLAAV